jgi:hypothetical protein
MLFILAPRQTGRMLFTSPIRMIRTTEHLPQLMDGSIRLSNSRISRIPRHSSIQQDPIEYLPSFSFDPERKRFYFSVVIEPEVNGVRVLVAAIYQLIPDAPGYTRLWANSIGKMNNFYPGYYGSAKISQVKGGYLVVQVVPCYGCSPGGPSLVLVLNSATRAERVLGTIGNVNLDLDQNRVTYQQLVEKKVPCGTNGGEGCFSDSDGDYMFDYVPDGDILSADLP